MSDYAVSSRRPRALPQNAAIESRLMFGACYALFLVRAAVTRAMPWRRSEWRRKNSGTRESIFSEANTAASVLVTSSFMGL